jgi:hypothetical protein
MMVEICPVQHQLQYNMYVQRNVKILICAQIKKKIEFYSYIRKFRGIGCRVIYD